MYSRSGFEVVLQLGVEFSLPRVADVTEQRDADVSISTSATLCAREYRHLVLVHCNTNRSTQPPTLNQQANSASYPQRDNMSASVPAPRFVPVSTVTLYSFTATPTGQLSLLPSTNRQTQPPTLSGTTRQHQYQHHALCP